MYRDRALFRNSILQYLITNIFVCMYNLLLINVCTVGTIMLLARNSRNHIRLTFKAAVRG